jgi:AbrB family looped-hinge helix DNA binding protein
VSPKSGDPAAGGEALPLHLDGQITPELYLPFLVSLEGLQLHASQMGEVSMDAAAEPLPVAVAHLQVLVCTAGGDPAQLVLPGNTLTGRPVDPSAACSMTSKGQVTIPKALRQQLGLGRGSRVCFELVGDHIELRPWKPQQDLPESGFGLLKSQRPPVPVDFDPASLLLP